MVRIASAGFLGEDWLVAVGKAAALLRVDWFPSFYSRTD